MHIQDNSPMRGCIRWHDVKILYEGAIYSIKDGYTKHKYVYWSSSKPNEFLTGDIIPYTHTEIVLINNGGAVTTYPLNKIEILGDSQIQNESSLLYEHITNELVHFTGMDKELLYLHSDKIDKLTNDTSINLIKLDVRIIAIENELPSILRRLNDVEEQLEKIKKGEG